MKTIILAGLMSAALIGEAHAMPNPALDRGLASAGEPALTNVYWMSRYGKRCYHGPVWIPACHATNRPVGYMRGHWNATRTRFIPGRYY